MVTLGMGILIFLPPGRGQVAAAAEMDPEIRRTLEGIRWELNLIREELRALRGTRPSPGGPNPPTKTSEPPPRITRVSLGSTPPLGSEAAPVTVVEFSDYQCPFCAAFARTTLPKIKDKYIASGKVRWVAREYPLPVHPQAPQAAHAALCAGRQGKYWQMHDKLHESQALFKQEPWDKLAEAIGLDLPAFRLCMESRAFEATIQKDRDEGKAVGVTGTPSFFIGLTREGKFVEGVSLAGNQPFQTFETEIEKLLAKASTAKR